MSGQSILIIDDEDQIRKVLTITLQSNGFVVTEAGTGKAGLTNVAMNPPDLVLLDLGLPDTSGHEVLKRLRDWYTNPIIMVSVLDSDEEIMKALNNGANDFLVKPFRTEELLSRIHLALRKPLREPNRPVLNFHDLVIDFATRIIQKHGHPVQLTQIEYSLLTILARNEGKVLTNQYLLKEILGSVNDYDLQFLRVHISDIRKKIETDPNRPVYIITERGVGYRFIGNKSPVKR